MKKQEKRSVDNEKIETVIGSDCVFEGIILLNNSMLVQGNIKGKVESKGQVILGKESRVEADIVSNQVMVNGSVKGNIVAYEQLNVGATGRIRGNVEARSVSIALGGLLDGFCHMLTDSMDEDDLDAAGSYDEPFPYEKPPEE